MDEAEPRAVLAALIAARNDDFSALSRLLGRNPAYVQQFIRRGTPKRLAERDRALLARYFGVEEAVLGGPERVAPAVLAVPRYDIRASAGPGALTDADRATGSLPFDRAWLKARGGRDGELSVIRVTGDSMAPALLDGDDILVDRSRIAASEGIHVLRLDGALVVKRVKLLPGDRIAVISDNPDYPKDVRSRGEVEIVGRVIWIGRAL